VGQNFLVDTGATLTHISIPYADHVGLPYTRTKPIQTATIMGRKKTGGYLAPLVFALKDLPQWTFTTQACFSTDVPPGGVPLLSNSDLLQHFTIFMNAADQPGYSEGVLVLTLRDDHGGEPRELEDESDGDETPEAAGDENP
jgi:hypothetical protein